MKIFIFKGIKDQTPDPVPNPSTPKTPPEKPQTPNIPPKPANPQAVFHKKY